MAVRDGKQVYGLWLKAWNDDISIIDELAAPECTVHQARFDRKDSKAQKGGEALKEIIISGHAFFDNGKTSVEIGPIEENGYVSARWKFTGTYNGKIPGAQAEAGEVISFHGMDIFFLEEGKIKDYWVCSDGVHLMQQLNMLS